MAEPFVAEIRIFPLPFAPKGWAWCDGQLISVSQNMALFSLLGTTYGGDGESNFALPDLQGRVPMHPGQGPGLSPRVLGETGGVESVTLLESEIPAHDHTLRASSEDAELRIVSPNRSLGKTMGGSLYAAPGSLQPMAEEALLQIGSDAPHNNLQQYLALYFNIALQGELPLQR